MRRVWALAGAAAVGDGGDRDEFERTAHRKALFGTIGKYLTASGVESGDTQAPAVTQFEDSER